MSNLKFYQVKLFVSVVREKDCDFGIIDYKTYAEDKFNAVMYAMKELKLDELKNIRAKQVRYDDELCWYDITNFTIVRVVEVKKM